MDVFKLRDDVVSEYRDYVESFVRVYDPRVNQFVREQLAAGELWPEAVLQLNPAFVQDDALGEMAQAGTIRPETARFFGEGIRLYRHQQEALTAAQRGEPYVLTTGTGSGKSLTYLVPIYDAILNDQPERHSVRAIIVYPMNALINSQLDTLRSYADAFPGSPVRFDQYTGQTREEDRQRILEDPPHILLTNYVMLEYLLTRPFERSLLRTATRDLRFLVMDELHFYRGRQGADVGMLLRRVQGRAGGNLQFVGTSATMASEGDREARREAVAQVATRLFGTSVPPTNVIDETLQRVVQVPSPATPEDLRRAVNMPPPEATPQAVMAHPLAAWVEEAFGLSLEDGRLVRSAPRTFANAVRRLGEETGLEESRCAERLRAVLDAGSQADLAPEQPVFAFRLHQFLSSGSSVRATMEPLESRHLTMEGQYRADGERVLFPLAFCRECGQDYYLVSLIEEDGVSRFIPRAPMGEVSDEDIEGEPGYFAIEDGDLWAGDDEELPEFWFDELRRGRRIKEQYASHRPREFALFPDGHLNGVTDDGVSGWFQPSPLLLCLRCRAAYTLRESDYRKLASLSQTGRSTATTVVVNAAVTGMAGQGLPRDESKILSFTDNRQDASLQAGHLNDFVQVAQLRAAIVEALRRHGTLSFDQLGEAVFAAMDPAPRDFLKEPVDSGPGYNQGRKAMIDLLEYRALEDLSRGWRVVQPNLEQAGLLRIEYEGLDDLAADDSLWQGLPATGDVPSSRREEVLWAVLDHLRMQLAIDAEPLTETGTRALARSTGQWLRDPWALEERDRLRTQGLALLPGVQPDRYESQKRMLRLGARSAVARYLRSGRTWANGHDLSAADAEALVQGIVARLRGHILTVVTTSNGEDRGVRVLAGALRWTSGDGQPLPPDPVRSRSLHLRREVLEREPNRYFTDLYGQRAREFRGMLGGEHTGMVNADRRIEREGQFRKGELPALFCSPTMELGVDIRELHSVHMRNLPPTPANYAQRSGRAGRGGRPALIAAFAAQGNAHDQYFFRERNRMIAGAVAPARMDLRNQELLKAHLHSEWLAIVGFSLGRSIVDILDLDEPDFPILSDKHAYLEGDRHLQFEADAIYVSGDIVERAPEIKGSWWYSEDWLRDTIRNAPHEFDRAFDRWRELYRAAVSMRDSARRAMDAPRASRTEREEARQREREAQREIDLLLNRSDRFEDSDFYPYRYLAAEGFLPGYNFPRLPVRALMTVKDTTRSIDRYRFLGLTEFAPGNVIYHEGRKHRVDSIVLPPSGIEARLRRAVLCQTCGYFHDEDSATVDLCQHCGVRLDAETSERPQRLLEQPAMRTRSVENISSDEEERIRSGYRATTHFRFAPQARERRLLVQDADGNPSLDVLYAPSARIWRINHGWRRGSPDGFQINPQTGRWQRREVDRSPEESDDPAAAELLTGVKPFVSDDRNLLLLKPTGAPATPEFLISLLYAIKRGIQFTYQVEEQEVAAELIGSGERRRLMFWEAAEGGVGVWERLVEEPEAFAEVSRQALRVCHFDPETGEEAEGHDPQDCAVACYQCLLSYANQLEHRHIDRWAGRDFLLRLASGATALATGEPDRAEQYRHLKGLTDPKSGLEIPFLDFLYEGGYRLPDMAQRRPERDVWAQPDFYYKREGVPGACVFVDGSDHLDPERKERDAAAREALENLGYRMIPIRFDHPLSEQVDRHLDIFGYGN